MKKLNKYFYFLLLSSLFVLSSCEDENPTFYKNAEGFIQFSSVSADLAEDNTAGLVSTVLFGGASNDDGITVNYTVTSDDNTRFTDPNNGTIEIPAGERTAEIVIIPVDNARTDGNLEIVIELSATSDKPVGIGGEGVNNNTKTITIVDNDCPITIADWVGTYTVDEVITDGGNAGLSLAAAFGESYQVELSLDTTDPNGITVIVNNSAGFNTYMPNGTKIIFNTCPGTVTLDPASPLIAGFRNMTIESSEYDENNFSIKCTGPVRSDLPYEFVLTKQ
ncbi:hypothetical protein [uncultured Tenacibaculum sp.]|uniref:hypothetical protein n=1 Tax=uncultured Tenacibaculum sp. TaxID=174713 RepID=UPI00262C76B8|nr:hypothetical protein [uncultured Tenacibaculum sp.]